MNIKEIICQKIAVHCDTFEKSEAFLKECEAAGIKWTSGVNATKNNPFNNNRENTCFAIHFENSHKFLRFDTRDYYQFANYTIIEYPAPTSTEYVSYTKRLETWNFPNGKIAVRFSNCEVKEGDFLISAFGKGNTFFEACEDYIDKIKGKTLVFNAYTKQRKEVVFDDNMKGCFKIDEAIRHLEKPLQQLKKSKIKINKFAKDVHKTAVEHGWWEKEPSFPEIIALCHSELSEALEEYRKDGDVCYYLDGDGDITTDMTAYKGQELHGTGVELADCILRILDYCAAKDIDIEQILRLKNEYNKNRPYKHGGKRI